MLAYAIATFSAVFAVTDPIGLVPIYLAMTKAHTPEQRKKAAIRAAFVMAVTLGAFALTGTAILQFFGISLGAFRIAGGVLLFLLAIDMLRAQPSRQRTSPEEEAAGAEQMDVSIFPLGIPMLAGPGSIATVIVLMTQATLPMERFMVFVAIFVTSVVTAGILIGGTFAERRLGHTGLGVLERVMGLLLAAIAIQFVVDGTIEVFPGLGTLGS